MMRHRVASFVGLACLALSATGCKKKGGSPASGGAAASGAPAPAGGNLIKNPDFEDGTSLPWTTSFSQPADGEASVVDGALCLRVDSAGPNAWDAQVRHREMTIESGHSYTVSFRIWSDKPTMARPKIGASGPPYAEYWSNTVKLSSTPQTVTGTFTHNGADDPIAEFAFHVGGNMARDTAAPFTVCIDDVFLSDPEFTPPPRASTRQLPAVRVNQVGYFPNAKKIAAWVSQSAIPVDFKVFQAGNEVGRGKTQPVGLDADSGENLHVIDFSSVKATGKGFTVVVEEDQSFPFQIGGDLYSQMKYDALSYFYHNRSGIAIEMPYAGHERWTRPAGHARSDKSVPCAKDAGCSYSLDVTGGWYDAGDHGKYVVNGGISVWTLQNQYERFKTSGDASPFEDGKLSIPENGNGVPDLLDEARWQMEFLLKMQVPDGKEKAGMVHHKIHDENWTALGIRPDEAEGKVNRFLRPVSTAATLNLAATAAQAARLFKAYDPKFAARCQAAAEKAWAAAKQNPALFASPADGNGGGPYDDREVKDDFFWAASELWITTKNPTYKAELQASPYWQNATEIVDGVPSSMNWAATDMLGTISLALVPGALGAGEQASQKKKLVDAADRYLSLIDKQGYRLPFSAGSSGKYPWGSNSFVLNNVLILALAHDLTDQDKYLEGAILGLDYILGRNALAQSYVTGYGTLPLVYPHHRFWAKQADARFPLAPPGAVSGGPNSSLQDPYVKAAGLSGCHPQKCFIDHIEAWSVNEITINWNAPFAWVTAYLDENGKKAKPR